MDYVLPFKPAASNRGDDGAFVLDGPIWHHWRRNTRGFATFSTREKTLHTPPAWAPYGYGLLKTRCRRRCWKGRRKKLRRLLQTRQRRTKKSQLDLIPTPFYPHTHTHTHTHKIPLPAQDSKIPWSWDNFLLLDWVILGLKRPQTLVVASKLSKSLMWWNREDSRR